MAERLLHSQWNERKAAVEAYACSSPTHSASYYRGVIGVIWGVIGVVLGVV